MEFHEVCDLIAARLMDSDVTWEDDAIEMIAHKADGDETYANRILDRIFGKGIVRHIDCDERRLLVTIACEVMA